MEEEIIQFHIGLHTKENVPQQGQGLVGKLNGKCFVEPDTGGSQAIEVEAQGREKQDATNDHILRATKPLQESFGAWYFWRSCYIRL